jgi:PBP1b-binding outer membrane lipoprotein LpoB
MKKILVISGIILGAIFLSGCSKQNTPTTNSQLPVSQANPSVPESTQTQTDSSTSDNSTANLQTTPAKTSDVDASLNEVTKDLNSIDSTAPNPNDLNSTDLQK